MASTKNIDRRAFAEAITLIEEKGWTQGAPARNADGKRVDPCSDEAMCFCTLGAMARAAKKDQTQYDRLYNAFVVANAEALRLDETNSDGSILVWVWNDYYAKRDDVVAAFQRAREAV